jgi:hypothetical protein
LAKQQLQPTAPAKVAVDFLPCFVAVVVLESGYGIPYGVRLWHTWWSFYLHDVVPAAPREEGRAIWERRARFYHHRAQAPLRLLTLEIQNVGKGYNPAHEISVSPSLRR